MVEEKEIENVREGIVVERISIAAITFYNEPSIAISHLY